MSSGISRSDIKVAYRLFLGREPETEEITQAYQSIPDLDSLRRTFLGSPEFQSKYGSMALNLRSVAKFFHSFELPGESIKGVKPIEILRDEEAFVFRHSVVGQSVLDIGAWDGYFSFAAERHGARHVMSTDHFCWSGPGWGSKAGFDYIHLKTGSSVQSSDVDVFSLDPEKLGRFDNVLFLGVLYHLKNPFGGLEKAAAMCLTHLVVETEQAMKDCPEPVMRYYLRDELGQDPTNYWTPNLPCLINMLRELGFSRFEHESDKEVGNRLRLHAWR
jgi:tRNA (mo5U34)-methyltransferase